MRFSFAWIPLALLCAHAFAAEEKKPEKKKEPPHIAVVIPFNLIPGETNKIKIRGLNLTNVSEIRFADSKQIEAVIKSRGKAEVPKEADVKKWGDTQLEVEVKLPPEIPTGTNSCTMVSPEGESEPRLVAITSRGSLLMEKEPNGSFKQAQAVEISKTVQGTVAEPKDVDVFRFEGKHGQQLVVEVVASRYGSLLDPVLTLYDAHGHIIVSVDDVGESNDAMLRATLPADGNYFISVIDANDRGGQAYNYNLLVRVK